MIEIFVAFLAGVGVTVLLRSFLQPSAPPPSEGTTSGRSPVERLQALTAALTTAGDASAHPRDMTSQSSFREAVGILREAPLSVVTDYATGATWVLSAAAHAALKERDDRQSCAALLERHFRNLTPWPVYYGLKYFASLETRPPVGSLLIGVPEYWSEQALVPGMFADYFSDRAKLGDNPTFGDSLERTPAADATAAEALLRRIDHPTAQSLLDELAAWRRQSIDRTFLQTFGRFIERASEDDLLIEHAAVREDLDDAEDLILEPPFRSILVVGEPRLGKTTFLGLLAMRAAAKGWTLFEAGATALMSGQTYFGQLEERMRRLIDELSVDKRVIWYVPDFLQLASSGMHQAQAASLLDQILPAVATGRLVVLSETTPAALTALLQRRPALRTALDVMRLRPLNDGEVHTLMSAVAARLPRVWKIDVDPEVVKTTAHLAKHYLGTGEMPGVALDLLKLSARRVASDERTEITRDDVLATLSQITGMPPQVLDDRERVDLATLRRFFAARVMGQDEAVDVVVDRIAMLKAGLTDPGKPIGVFLFAGPTGTGKTELAKTLAEYLFGSPDRLIRLDMSEFQAVESTRKILGEADQQGDTRSLTHRVRNQPFSVVLLDEFEKAHPNAWDLFLQVFDDGRLTDAAGQTVDFRHCIIILTSNLGSTIQQGAGLGFVSQAGGFSPELVMRTIGQSFRPEFVNRLDAIIVFRPLTRDLMRGILSKELARVLDRRGLRHREWAVEWESSALDFLLDKGFSPAMGARPLKRAIDRHLLAPLAATLVERRFPEGDQFLFVRSDGRGIQVEFVDPDAPPEVAPTLEPPRPSTDGPTLERIILHATGTADERAALTAELERMELRLNDPAWTSLAEELVGQMQQPDFWSRADRHRTLARYAAMDRVKAATETARSLEARHSRSGSTAGYSRDLASRLASQVYVVHHGIDDVLTDAPVEVMLTVQPIRESSADAAAAARWSERIMDMYRGWATRRHMLWEEVAPALVLVSGFGAMRILEREAGLHILEYENTGEELARAVARVRVAVTPDGLPEDVPAKRAALVEAINRLSGSPAVVRRYRLEGSPLVRDVSQGWRTGRTDLVLQGNFDLLGATLGKG